MSQAPALNAHLAFTPPAPTLLGRKIEAIDPADGSVSLSFFARPEFANRHGSVQGGLASAMLDSATSVVLLAQLPPELTSVTMELNTTFLRPAPLGPLTAKAWLVSRDEREARTRAELFGPDGEMVAKAVARLRIRRREPRWTPQPPPAQMRPSPAQVGIMPEPSIRVLKVEVLSDDWATLKKTTLEYLRRDGTWSTQIRQTYDRGDGAAVLPYDPARGTVLLVRQFRYPAYVHGHHEMLIEVCAGLLDADDPETCARKEAEEELGYQLGRLNLVFDAFMSPGSVTERLSLYRGPLQQGRPHLAGGRPRLRGRGYRGAGARAGPGAGDGRSRRDPRRQDHHAAAARQAGWADGALADDRIGMVAGRGDLSDLSAQFLDSDGDGVGDLPGIAGKLDYVASLGVNGIWLSPFFTSPMKDFGYDVSDYRDVDPLFGTLADFDALLARAHGLGLKVIIDQVYAHTSEAHAWFKQSAASRTTPRPTGTSGPIPSRTGRRRTTGWACSAGRRGPGAPGGGSTICTTSSSEQPQLNSQSRRCSRRSWMWPGSGWTAASTGSGWTWSTIISTTPP